MKTLQFIILKWLLYKVYSGGLFKSFGILQPGSKIFEEKYKEERYKLIKNIDLDDRIKYMKLLALNTNYLVSKTYDLDNFKSKELLKGRVFQTVFEYSLFDLVNKVEQKEILKMEENKKLDK